MRALDPRLLRDARAARRPLVACVLSGTATAVALVAQADVLSSAIGRVFGGASVGIEAIRGGLTALGIVVGLRALVAWGHEVAAHRASAMVKSALRVRLTRAVLRLGPGWLADRRTGSLTTLATTGLDGLDGYVGRYLPQLVLAVVVPSIVVVRLAAADWLSAVVIGATLPLVPVFMALVGRLAQARARRRWRALDRLAYHFTDVLAGLPTAKAFGRARRQVIGVRAAAEAYRRESLGTMRIAFLSALVLELAASLSVAVVAVEIGLRVIAGDLDLATGLLVLILAPEVYLPLRQLGASYHASVDGLAAADEAYAVLDAADAIARPESAARVAAPDPGRNELVVERLSVRYDGREAPALDELTLRVRPGEVLALAGESGAGKTTLLNVLLGFVPQSAELRGRVRIGEVDLATVSPREWRRRVAWVPQAPRLRSGTVGSNVRLGVPAADDRAVRRALADCGAADLTPATRVGEGGAGLSEGQRRGVALARAVLRLRQSGGDLGADPAGRVSLVLLDEPTAGLDAATEAAVVRLLRTLDVTVLVVSHRPAVLAAADRVVRLDPPGCEVDPESQPPQGFPADPKAELEGEAEAAAAAEAEAEAEADEAATERPTRALVARFAAALAAGIGASACGVGLLATAAWLLSRAAQHPPVLTLMVAIVAVRAFGIGRGALRYTERLLSHDAAFTLVGRIRARVYARLERLAPAGLRSRGAGDSRLRSGDLVARAVSDVEAIQDLVLRAALPATATLVVSLGALGFVGLLEPVAALGLAGAFLVGFGLAPLAAVRLAGLAESAVAPLRGRLAASLAETFGNAAELLAFGATRRAIGTVQAYDRRLRRCEARTAWTAGFGGAFVTLAVGGASWVALAAGARAVAAGTLAPTLLAVVVLLPLALLEPLRELPAQALTVRRSRAALARIDELGRREPPVREPARPIPLRAPAPGLDSGPVRYQLRARELSVGWPGGAPVLAGVELELPPGARLAVVGRSGAGKTTLAYALARFLEPRTGAITLQPPADSPATEADPTGGPEPAEPAGELDTRRLDGDELRSRAIGLLDQDAHVFDTSIAENLRLARPHATDAELVAALHAARLWTFVRGLPDGLDTLVGEHGGRLSGGQRQRLNLARALLTGVPILVLDEPTEHLDEPTARSLVRDLLSAAEADGRSIVLVTHRRADLASVDGVLDLDAHRPASGASLERPRRVRPRLLALP